MGERVPRFRLLVLERRWQKFEVFDLRFTRAARTAADKEERPSLRTVTVSRRTFSRWMSEGVRTAPTIEVRLVLKHLFGMPVETLFELVDPDTFGLPLEAGPDEDLVPTEFPALEFDDPQQVRDQTGLLTASNTDAAVLTMAATAITGIVDRYERLGPHQLVGEAKLLRGMLHTLLVGHQPPRTRTELYRLAGQASGLLGYMAINADRPAAAQAYSTEALELAGEIGDRGLQMWALGTRSLGYYYQGRYDLADEAAAAGVALAPEHPQAIRLLANGRARALARAGHRLQALNAIDQALQLSDRHDVPPGLTPCIAFAPYSAARTLANVVTAHLSIGDTDQVLDRARDLEPMLAGSGSVWSRALVGLDVATALLQQAHPDVEMAMDLGQRALGSGTAAPIRSVWLRGVELYTRAATRWKSEPVVGGYAERLRAFRAHPTAGTVAGSTGIPGAA
ncbi:hypothetical protein PUR61_01965 [Streptomyces sp. BE20]|uniref:hypothetical protein n=1 Tax=Streptomyces sp. BE20 TaxID=3002525 RepID=UPI002E775904|nr:hypothetical protein [Streptomyces sp. BE20]MEE1820972.1 hypothetical protein [Streptomyces sp. BE20]